MDGLSAWFDHASYRDGQESTIASVRSGVDCLAVLPTSAGKSLTYQLPGLEHRAASPRATTVVVCPLISLVQDQVDRLNERFGLDASGRPRRRVEGDADVAAYLGSAQPDPGVEGRAASGAYAFLFLCPESLERAWNATLCDVQVPLVVVDEAHCVSSHGLSFRPHYRALGLVRETRPEIPLLALTATANAAVSTDIVRSLGFRTDHRVVRTSANRPNLFYEVHRKTTVDADVRRVATLVRDATGQAFVYVVTRAETERLATRLATLGLDARAYHAGQATLDRAATMEAFADGRLRALVCTIACGMGIDNQRVNLVVHYGLPRNLSAYAQESGRAGRSGASARCVLFAGPGDAVAQNRFVDDDDADAPRKRRAIRVMADYASSTTCRRRLLLAAFEETLPPGLCRTSDGRPGCDRCLGAGAAPKPPVDCTAVATALLGGLATLRYTGAKRLVAFCVGSKARAYADLARRPGFGALSSTPKRRVEAVLDALVDAGYVVRASTDKGFPTIARTALPVPTRIELPVDPVKPERKRRREPDDADRALFDALRRWRFAAAKAAGLSVWMPASNAVLSAIAAARPMTLEELGRVDGIGEGKLARYGEALLAVVRAPRRA